MTSVGLCFSSDVITFDQNWDHLYSCSAGGNDLSNDTQIRAIGSVRLEVYTKILGNLTEKLRAKLPATTRDYSMEKFARLNDAFSEFLGLEASF